MEQVVMIPSLLQDMAAEHTWVPGPDGRLRSLASYFTMLKAIRMGCGARAARREWQAKLAGGSLDGARLKLERWKRLRKRGWLAPGPGSPVPPASR